MSGEATSAKREVEEVIIDLSREVRRRLEREASIETRVADITPVSSEPVSFEGLVLWRDSETHSRIGGHLCRRIW